MMTRRTQAVLTLVGVFVLGAVCGALGFGVFVRNEVRQAQMLRERKGFEEFFVDRLRLTQEQRDSLEDELTRTYDDFATLRAAVAEEYGELLDTLDRRISPRLTPDQRERLRAAENRFRRGFPHRRQRMGFDAPPTGATVSDTGRSTPAPLPKNRPTPPKTAPSPAPLAAPSDTVAVGADSAAARIPGEGLGRLPMTLQRELKLNDTQFAAVRRIAADTRRQLRSDVTELRGYPRLQIGAAMRRIGEMEQRLATVLTPEQMASFAPIRDKLMERMKTEIWEHRGMPRHGRGGRGGPGRGMQRMTPNDTERSPEVNR